MADSGSHHNYVLLNPRDVEIYIRGICDAYNETPLHNDRFSPAAIDHVCATLVPVIAKNGTCMRKAAEADFAAHDPEAITFQREVLGRKFYVFDSKDRALDAAVIQAAKLIQVMIDTRETFNRLGAAPEAAAAYLRPDFLYAALAVPRTETQTVVIERAAAVAAPEPPSGKIAEHQPVIQAPAVTASQPSVEVSMQLEDDWRIERLYDGGLLNEANRKIGNGLLIDREKMRDRVFSYYAAVDDKGDNRALFSVNNGQNLLMLCRSGADMLPDAETARRILKFIEYRDLRVHENAANTGFWRAADKKIVALLDMPENFTASNDLKIDGLKQPFSLRGLKKTHGEIEITNSPGLLSLGDLEQTHGSITIRNCENFHDLGALQSLYSPRYYTHLYLDGCKSLASLGQIREIDGHLGISGTAVRQLPATLKSVSRTIITDMGSFSGLGRIGRASRALGRNPATEQKFLPAPSHGGPA